MKEEGGAVLELGFVDGEVGRDIDEGTDGGASFEAGQRRAEAKVDATTEAQVRVRVAADVEAVGIVEPGWVAVGRTEQSDDERAGGDAGTGELDLARGDAAVGLHRCIEPERFVDVDGIEYVDFCLGDTGAMTGHAPEPTLEAFDDHGTLDRTVDERVAAAMAWLLDQQLNDGGWNCDSVRTGSTHGSFNTTILALEALSEWQARGQGDRRTTLAAERGREFFLNHRLYRSHRTGELVNQSFTRLAFPPGWHHDLLRGLDHFRQARAPIDDRLADAVDRLRSRRRADGTWPAYAPHPGRYWFELETPGQASRINTLRALRVLRWWTSKHSVAAL